MPYNIFTMKTSSWQEFINQIYQRIIAINQDGCGVPFFRGQTNVGSYYKLIPKIYRKDFFEIYNKKPYFEYNLYFDFVTIGGNQINKDSTWHNLFVMQHYGLPTRLLDWTDNFVTALYFAMKDYDENLNCNPEIVIINPFDLNKVSFGIDELFNPELTRDFPRYLDLVDPDVDADNVIKFRKPYPFALYPYRFNSRLIAQGGYFTFHGTEDKGIDELIPNSVFRFTIPKDAINDARIFLELSGVNEYKLFTDLDSLGKHLKSYFY
jgi:hypothetical protein